MSSNIIHNGFAFRIPGIPARYRANCSKEWGCFVTGDTNGMNVSQAEKARLTRGSFVEMALVQVSEKILTFEPNYINEPFTEVWGIPVAGEMKTHFHEKCSELSTFLIHRQSQDRMKGMIEEFSRNVFSAWVEDGMQGDLEEYSIEKGQELRFSTIFRFQFERKEGKFGPYYFIKSSSRPPANDFELAALAAAKQIYATNRNACIDPRLVENEFRSLNSMQIEPSPASEPVKSLKGGK